MRTRLSLAVIAGLFLLVMALPAAAQSDDATVYVVHGIPGATVDVYVNGDLTVEGFEPGTITDALSLPAGTYDLDIRAAGEAADAEPIVSASADVPAGANISVVAHLNEAGDAPTITPFVNDVSNTEAGQARVTVRHTAAAPAVDVLANGEAAFSDLSNPNEVTADLPAGTISAAVALAGTTDPVLGPVDVNLEEGTNTIVYAIGSAEEGSLDLLVQVLTGLHSAPDRVESGTGGAADTGMPGWALLTMVAAGGVAVASTVRLAVLRNRA